MQCDLLASLRQLSDVELVARVKNIAARERGATALLVAHLAELDTRDLHLRAGYSSLFSYCRDALGLSEHEAYNRIEVARAARRFPLILEMLAAGSAHLTAVRLLAPHLTAENHRHVLESVRGKKRSEVEEMVARLSPRPHAAAFLRRLPAPEAAPVPAPEAAPVVAPAATPIAAPSAAAPHDAEVARPLSVPVAPGPAQATPTAPGLPPPAASRPSVTALSPDRYQLKLTIGGETVEKLRLARDLLRHALPAGDDAALLDRALTALLADLARKKFAARSRPGPDPRPSRATASGSRHIPAAVKRAVWLRDLGRCAFIGEGGRRCGERGFVEFHHVTPYEVGGAATVKNIELRCKHHNDHEARTYFGPLRALGDARAGAGAAAGFIREKAARNDLARSRPIL